MDDYSFDPHYFEYEDAGHHGINPDDSYAGTRILKRYYDRWVKRTVECKSEIERMAYTASTPYGEEWAVGWKSRVGWFSWVRCATILRNRWKDSSTCQAR